MLDQNQKKRDAIDPGIERSKDILKLHRKKEYQESYKGYKELFKDYPSQESYNNINNILVSIYNIIKSGKNVSKELIDEFFKFNDDYLNLAKEDKAKSTLAFWAENILLDLFKSVIEINIIKFDRYRDGNLETLKSDIYSALKQYVSIFTPDFEENAFLETFIAVIFRERANFERKKSNIYTKCLAEVFLDFTNKNPNIKKSRSSIFNLLSDLQISTFAGKDFDTNYKKAIEYLTKSIEEYSDNKFAKNRKEELEKVAITHDQIRKFRHDTTSKLSSIGESVQELLKENLDKGKNIPEEMLRNKLNIFRNKINEIRGVFNFIQNTKPDYSQSFYIEGFLTSLLPNYQNLNESCIVVKNKDLRKKITFDSNYITMAIDNLVKNSLEAYRRNKIEIPKNPVLITLDYDSFLLTIEDYAGGVKKEFGDKIFEPYVSSKGTQSNIGMGLAMIKTIIEIHGWEIRYENTEKGVKFIIKINKEEEEY